MDDNSNNNKSESNKSIVKTWETKTLMELKAELSKIGLDVRLGVENNTSLLSKLRKYIARYLTVQNKK